MSQAQALTGGESHATAQTAELEPMTTDARVVEAYSTAPVPATSELSAKSVDDFQDELSALWKKLDNTSSDQEVETILGDVLSEGRAANTNADMVRLQYAMKVGIVCNKYLSIQTDQVTRKTKMDKLKQLIGRKQRTISSYMNLAKYPDATVLFELGLARVDDVISRISNLAKMQNADFETIKDAFISLGYKDDCPEKMLDFAVKIAEMPAGKFNRFALGHVAEEHSKSGFLNDYPEDSPLKFSDAKIIYGMLTGETETVPVEATTRKQQDIKITAINSACTAVMSKLERALASSEAITDERLVVLMKLSENIRNKIEGYAFPEQVQESAKADS